MRHLCNICGTYVTPSFWDVGVLGTASVKLETFIADGGRSRATLRGVPLRMVPVTWILTKKYLRLSLSAHRSICSRRTLAE